MTELAIRLVFLTIIVMGCGVLSEVKDKLRAQVPILEKQQQSGVEIPGVLPKGCF